MSPRFAAEAESVVQDVPAATGEPDSLAGVRAVILAGGRGTRLAPYTSVLPKPLMPVGDQPILEIVLGQLAAAGVENITLCVGYLSHLIRAVLEDNGDRSFAIEYVHESQPLGTAAPVKLVPGLDGTFVVMNGDVLSTVDYRDLVRSHRKQESVLTIATHERRVKLDYGIVYADESGRVVDFEEKPEITAAVSMGIYVMEPEVLEYIPDGQYSDFPDLVRALLAAGRKVSSYLYDGLWFDIGRHDDFQRAVAAWSAVNGVEHTAEPVVLERSPEDASPPSAAHARGI